MIYIIQLDNIQFSYHKFNWFAKSNHVYTYIYIEYDFPKEIAMAVDNGLSTMQVKIGLQHIFGSLMDILQCPLDLCAI